MRIARWFDGRSTNLAAFVGIAILLACAASDSRPRARLAANWVRKLLRPALLMIVPRPREPRIPADVGWNPR
jgi:hypothetical protein